MRKFIGYFRLAEACQRPGCPVCRCVNDDSRRHLQALIDEHVNDPDTRRRMRAAWGLCNWHTWMLRTIPIAKTGSAIIYEDVLRVAVRRVEKLKDRPRFTWFRKLIAPTRPRLVERYMNRAHCPVCLASRDAELRYVDTAVDFAEDSHFALMYAESAGLCIPHIVHAIHRCSARPELGRLLQETTRKWRELCRNLEGFVRKHEYRHAEPISEAETSACEAAFEMLAGAPGLFGNGLHQEGPGALGTQRPDTSPVEKKCQEFDRPALESRIAGLSLQLGEASRRAAALHDQLARVAEDRNVLELNLAAERGANALALKRVAELQSENAQLRAAQPGRDCSLTDRAG
jgi:Family of unknown function (DUF6062)